MSDDLSTSDGFFATVRDAIRGIPHDYTSGNLGRAIILLAVPMILEMVMESVFAVCDIFFVARIGTDAVATVGLTESLLTLLYAVAIGLAMATTAMVSRRIGEKKPEAAATAAVQAIWLGLGISALVGIPCYIYAPKLLEFMGASAGVIETGVPYTRILLGFNVVIVLLYLNNAIFRGAYSTATESPGNISREEFDALANAVQDLIIDPDIPSQEGDDDWEVWTPAATLTMFAPGSWTEGVMDSGMFYLSASEGFKAGGFTSFGDEFLPFDPEEIVSYEFGAKMDLLDRTLRINTSLYYSEYDDIQLRVTRTLSPTETISGIINAGEATISGAEIEMSWLPTDNILLGLTGAWIDAEYDEFIDEDADGNPVDRSDEDFAYIPEQTWSITAQYIWDLEVGELSPRLSGFYTDEVFIGLDAVAASEDIAYLDDYWIWNLRVPFRPAAMDNIEVAAYVNNMFDKEYFGTGIISTGGVGAAGLIAGKQQTWGVEVAYQW